MYYTFSTFVWYRSVQNEPQKFESILLSNDPLQLLHQPGRPGPMLRPSDNSVGGGAKTVRDREIGTPTFLADEIILDFSVVVNTWKMTKSVNWSSNHAKMHTFGHTIFRQLWIGSPFHTPSPRLTRVSNENIVPATFSYWTRTDVFIDTIVDHVPHHNFNEKCLTWGGQRFRRDKSFSESFWALHHLRPAQRGIV